MIKILFVLLLSITFSHTAQAGGGITDLQDVGREEAREKPTSEYEKKVSPPKQLQEMDSFFEGNAANQVKNEGNDKKEIIIQDTSRNTVTDILESTVVEDKFKDMYVKSTVQNISKVYWLKGVNDINNDVAIDNFIRINECKFFEENFGDDFKWARVREAARQLIKEEKSNYSDKFKIIVPIDLGRYDHERKGFPITEETAFRQLRRVDVGSNRVRICGTQKEIKHFPRTVHLVLNKPLNYSFVDVDEHIAQAYILRNRNLENGRNVDLGQRYDYKRLAFARIRMTFMEYQGITRIDWDKPVAVMWGKIDGIDVFEYSDETGILSSVNYDEN